MEPMMIESLTGWHWLALGIALLLLETLGIGGILIGMGAGAIGVALLLAVVKITWQWQLVLFGAFSLVGTFIFWKYFRVKPAENATSTLNNRKAQLVGMRASLLQPVQSGRGKVQIQDALWTVTCTEELAKGALVEVVGYDDVSLHVKRV
jgi:membrane protein implicated in regulation of membrane protease activity